METRIASISGLRGVVGDGLDPVDVTAFAASYAAEVVARSGKDAPTVLVGHDARRSADVMTGAVLAGLAASGCHALALGPTATPTLGFLNGLELAVSRYLPLALPFAILTVVGGINVTESARLAGDDYDTRSILLTEAVSTLVAGLCGGVSQSTPYIGHPAYKAMGGRAAYTLATALFVGSAGLLGYFGFIYVAIAKPTVFPILVFIGMEITSQSFHATPIAHYPAVAFACAPALASLVMLFVRG